MSRRCPAGLIGGRNVCVSCAVIGQSHWRADNAAGLGANPTFARILGALYTLIAIGTIVYAYSMQRTRLRWIEVRHPGHHDELIGPLLLSAVLFAAVLLNFILRGTFPGTAVTLRLPVVNRNETLPAPKQPWLAAVLSNFVRVEGSL